MCRAVPFSSSCIVGKTRNCIQIDAGMLAVARDSRGACQRMYGRSCRSEASKHAAPVPCKHSISMGLTPLFCHMDQLTKVTNFESLQALHFCAHLLVTVVPRRVCSIACPVLLANLSPLLIMADTQKPAAIRLLLDNGGCIHGTRGDSGTSASYLSFAKRIELGQLSTVEQNKQLDEVATFFQRLSESAMPQPARPAPAPVRWLRTA
jgi:hypothetical protein